MPAKKLRGFLDGHDVKYVTITHSKAFTAQEVAASAHVPGKEMAKTVMVKLDGEMAMVVLTASQQIDFDVLKNAAGVTTAELAGEEEFKDMFPECEVGAMPPFGNLYGMDTFVSETLAEDKWISFNAGSHTELVRVAYSDFERLAEPKHVSFSEK